MKLKKIAKLDIKLIKETIIVIVIIIVFIVIIF